MSKTDLFFVSNQSQQKKKKKIQAYLIFGKPIFDDI